MNIKKKRVRRLLSTTVDEDILWVIDTLSEPKARGIFLDGVVKDWLVKSDSYFDIPNVGPVHLREDVFYYVWHDLNEEVHSPKFRTFREAFTWLKATYPDTNYDINIRS